MGGSGWPLALQVKTPNSAMAAVLMSKTKGVRPSTGHAKHKGFVPKEAFAPALAATNSGEFAVMMTIRPCFAARSP